MSTYKPEVPTENPQLAARQQPRGRRNLGFLVLTVCAVITVGGFQLVKVLGFAMPFHPAYKEAMQVARDSAIIRQRLGNIVVRPGTRGFVHRTRGISFAHMRIPVKGTNAEATLYASVTQMRGTWRVSDLVLQHDSDVENVSPPIMQQGQQARYTGMGKVYLLPLGHPDIETIKSEGARIRDRFGITVEVLPSQKIGPGDENPRRRQLIAENVISSIRRAHPDLEKDYDAFVIAVTDRDLYIRGYNWNFAFGLRSAGRFAVISSARLGSGPLEVNSPALPRQRLRKLLTKFIGILYYQLPLSVDPTSVLYAGLEEPADIDFMTEDFTGAFGSWKTMPGAAESCVTLFAARDRAPSWRLDCTHEGPRDSGSSSFLVDLEQGLFVQRHTDFRLGSTFPLVLQRMYRPEDERSRSFGIGTNHSFDIFLVGDSGRFTFIDLVQEDGSRVRFHRYGPGTDMGSAVFYAQAPMEFSGASIRWNGRGWDLRRLDGWTYVFPAAGPTSTPRQSALIAIHDDKGQAIQFTRDAKGLLRNVSHFDGGELAFLYDSLDRVKHAQDNQGRFVDYVYDSQGRLVRVSDSDGNVERYLYDASHRMLKVWWGNQLILTNEFDRFGHLVKQDDAVGQSFLYSYDGYNREMDMAHFTRPDGYTTHFYFRSAGGTTVSLPEQVKVKAQSGTRGQVAARN